MKNRICVLILGAGQGTRFGGPKIFGKYENRNFCEYISKTLEPFDFFVHWVLSSETNAEKLKLILQNDSLYYSINPDLNGDMFSSIVNGVLHSANPFFSHYLIWPVDFPFISSQTIQTIIEQKNHVDIVHPVFNNRKGHPILISKKAISLITSLGGDDGLRGVFGSHDFTCNFVEAENDLIHKNINFKTQL
jgi:molybdenum cofactor cytidylyltransferase